MFPNLIYNFNKKKSKSVLPFHVPLREAITRFLLVFHTRTLILASGRM